MLTRNQLRAHPKRAAELIHPYTSFLTTTLPESTSVRTALKYPEWTNAMKEELRALHDNKA